MSDSDTSSVLEAAREAKAKRVWHRIVLACCVVIILTLLSLTPTTWQRVFVGSSRMLSTLENHRVTKEAPPTCNDGTYSKHTLQLAYELPFAGLFDKYNRGRQKYEASSVIIVREMVVVLMLYNLGAFEILMSISCLSCR